ncbi:MarR family transcriptional regulator [Prescottella soli]|uniref:MarR family transcriptional regulator n=1 Tax=Prescottella soli TaxID=1543852 RepID=A0ABW9G1G8_9NOCA
MATRWLDEREDRAWRGLRYMHADLSAHLARQLTREYGLTEADYTVLVAVSEAPERRIRSRDLGRALGWERSRLSHQIARMEARGTVRRAPCDGDARGFDVVLTDEGMAAIEEAAPLHLAGVRHCFVDLLTPEQLEVLGDIADIVMGHLTAEHLDSTG